METQQQETMREKDFPHRRRPWTAVALSLISPGLGQIYCGSFSSGIAIVGTIVMFSVLWTVGIMHPKTPFLSFTLLMWSVISLATVVAAIDAYRRARRTRYDYTLKEYNHWGIYFVLIWIAGAGLIGYAAFFKYNLLNAFRIRGNSMAPTIVHGDHAIANRMAYRQGNPYYGDVVLFKNPQNRRVNNIKRVVALAGDTVRMQDGQLIINGDLLSTEWVEKRAVQMKGTVEGDVFREENHGVKYQIFRSPQTSRPEVAIADFGPITVPPYHCFLMSDNRNHLSDSRQYGSISVGALQGRFNQIYWPLSHRAFLESKSE